MAKMAKDVQTYQMDPIHAAEVAEEAGAKKLVFNHIVPPLPINFAETVFLEGTGDVFGGEIIMGEDNMRFELSPKN